VNVNEQQIKLV